jgi:DNA polymerase-1
LQEYGSLDGVVANADKIKGAAGENLRKALDWLPDRAIAADGQDRLRPGRLDRRPACYDSIAINDQNTLGLRFL